MLCLSKTNHNERMWKEYADNDRGVCIEYRFPTLFNKRFYAFQVNYDLEFIAAELFDENGLQNEASLQRWMFTKSKAYEHEQEVRLIGDHLVGIIEFDKAFFTAVYTGKQTSKRSISRIQWYLQRNNYSFSKCIPANY